MTCRFTSCLVLLALGAAVALSSRAQAADLPPGTPSVQADQDAFKLFGGGPDGASMKIAPVAHQPFNWCVVAQVPQPVRSPWQVQLALRTTAPIDKGDVLLADFWLRCQHSTSGQAVTEVVFERAGAPYNKSVQRLVHAAAEWKHISVPFIADAHYEPGQANLLFRLGYGAPHTLELAAVNLTNFKHALALADLPATPTDYDGHAPDAPWRKAAAQRIERLRKGDLTLTVVDAAGNPVPAAAVHVAQQRHAFAFGSAVAGDLLLGSGPDADQYRAIIARNFNRVVLENDLKWPSWESHRQRALDAVAWLRDHQIQVRGHNLVWPTWRFLPRDLKTLQHDPAALAQRIDAHITDEATALRGRLVEWDVLNEPVANRDLQAILGDHAMARWFQLAHQADPAARLFINDYNILSAGGMDGGHQEQYEHIIRSLLDQGAPLGGIGLQSHFSSDLTPPDRLLQILGRFAAFGLPLEVTELDVDVPDPQLQADYLRDFMTVLFSHKSVEGILLWGFWEGRHWRPNAALYRKDWSLKPNGQAWLDLVRKQWWTDTRGATDPQGRYHVRAFLGDYQLTIESHGHKATRSLTLPHEGATLRIQLD